MNTSLWVGSPLDPVSYRCQTLLPLLLLCLNHLSLDFIQYNSRWMQTDIFSPHNLLIFSVNGVLNCLPLWWLDLF